MADTRGASKDPDVEDAEVGTADAAAGRRRGARRSRRSRSERPLGQSSPWVPALMVTCFLLGLVWLVVYYLAGTQVPVMSGLGNANLLIGIGLIAAGFVVSTQWR